MVELAILTILMVLGIIFLKYVFGLKFKEIKKMAKNTELDELTKDLPNSEDITKQMLEIIKNTDVKVKKMLDENTGTSLYTVMNNTISLGNMENKFARVQTIAHECLHSIQSKRLLWFNFIYSNIYFAYYIISLVLTFLGFFENVFFHMFIILFLGIIWYTVRAYLETDAMTKAPYLANEYLKQTKLEDEKIKTLISSYNKINEQAIPMVNYYLIIQVFCRLILYSVISMIVIG